MKIAGLLDIPFITLDVEKEYKKFVVEDMFKNYRKGITPNPDVLCNEKIKFPFLLRAARKIKADYIVTGHYVRVKSGELFRGKDEGKDQSYFLYRLNEEDLKRVLFPIGDYTKSQIRAIAKKNKFFNYDKKGTVGICFIGKVNLKDFLKKKIKPKKGDVEDADGNLVGKHDGIFYYTIGQRLGPRYGIEIEKRGDDKKNLSRWYVARKDLKKNILVVAPEGNELLKRKKIIVKDFHLISDSESDFKNKKVRLSAHRNGVSLTQNVKARIRHVGELLDCVLSYDKKMKKFVVELKKAITGVSEGQAIVLYKGEKVLGGGTISF